MAVGFVEEALVEIISSDPTVQQLVGDRIYPDVLAQDCEYPAIAYRVVNVAREEILAGRQTGPPATEVIFYCVAKDPIGTNSPRRVASLIDKAVRLLLQGYSDVVIIDTSPQTMVDIQGCFFRSASDTFDDHTGTYQYASVYEVRHNEEAP